MSNNKKRTLDDMLGSSNTPQPVPTFTVPKLTITNQKWSSISQQVVNNRALVTEHSYMAEGTGKIGKVKLSHTHGEFNKRVSDSLDITTHNISTSGLGLSPQSFPKILDRLSTQSGAVDALRVIKGSHLTKGLTGDTVEKRKAAVELGAEIGISEYVRGSTVALSDASINLYRMKHGKISKTDFSDPKVGYTGAGKGGAERLRNLSSIGEVFSQYGGSLRSIYKNHASQKTNRPWEQGLDNNASDDDKFNAWQVHKFNSWTRREK